MYPVRKWEAVMGGAVNVWNKERVRLEKGRKRHEERERERDEGVAQMRKPWQWPL